MSPACRRQRVANTAGGTDPRALCGRWWLSSVLVPVIDDAAHVAQAGEPVLRQALVPEAAVEALDIGVLHRLAELDEARLDTVPDDPGLHRPARELRAVAGAAHLRQSALALDLVEQARDL